MSHVMTAVASTPALATERERQLLDQIAALEETLADRERRLDNLSKILDRMEQHIAIEREVTDRALRRRYWWW